MRARRVASRRTRAPRITLRRNLAPFDDDVSRIDSGMQLQPRKSPGAPRERERERDFALPSIDYYELC